MMADEKFTVYTDENDGKPKAAATFTSEADAQAFANSKRRTGSRVYTTTGDADKDLLARKFPKPEATRPANRAMEARLSAARAQLIDEQVTEEARAMAKETPIETATEETKAAHKEEAKKAEASTSSGEKK